STLDNFVWHAVRAFFEEGGKRLYVVRTFKPLADGAGSDTVNVPGLGPLYKDGCARKRLPESPTADVKQSIQIRARFPGAMGNVMRVRFTARVGQSILSSAPPPAVSTTSPPSSPPASPVPRRMVGGLLDGDVVLIHRGTSPAHAEDL